MGKIVYSQRGSYQTLHHFTRKKTHLSAMFVDSFFFLGKQELRQLRLEFASIADYIDNINKVDTEKDIDNDDGTGNVNKLLFWTPIYLHGLRVGYEFASEGKLWTTL